MVTGMCSVRVVKVNIHTPMDHLCHNSYCCQGSWKKYTKSRLTIDNLMNITMQLWIIFQDIFHLNQGDISFLDYYNISVIRLILDFGQFTESSSPNNRMLTCNDVFKELRCFSFRAHYFNRSYDEVTHLKVNQKWLKVH